jgi:hypothetical protein
MGDWRINSGFYNYAPFFGEVRLVKRTERFGAAYRSCASTYAWCPLLLWAPCMVPFSSESRRTLFAEPFYAAPRHLVTTNLTLHTVKQHSSRKVKPLCIRTRVT